MCLSLPGQLVERRGSAGVADVDGNRVEVDLSLLDDVDAGDWVLVHAGFAIQRYDEAEALATLRAVREALGAAAEPVPGPHPRP